MSETRSAVGSVETTVRDFWATRPVRPATGGKLGGVAAAIGNRYAVDPVLLRVAFVVAALYGGAGVLLYLLGWMLFPREERDGSGQVSTRTTSTPVLVVLAVLLIPALYALRNLPGVIGAVVGCVALYLLHRNRAEHGAGGGGSGPGGAAGSAEPASGAPAPEAPPPGEGSSGGTAASGDTAAGTRPDATAPSAEGTRAEPAPVETARAEAEVGSASGDEARAAPGPESDSPQPGTARPDAPQEGAAAPETAEGTRAEPDRLGAGTAEPGGAEAETDRFTAWQPPAVDPWNAPPATASSAEPQLPQPPPPAEPVPERPRFDRMLTPIALLLTALTAAGGLYLSLPPAQILAAVLGVLGLGMLGGAVLHRGRALVVLAIPVAVLTVLAAGAAPHSGSVHTAPPVAANRHLELTTAAEANRAHSIDAGNLTVDLRGMPPQEASRVGHVQARTGAGSVTVHVPPAWDVTAHCTSRAGTVDCLGTERSGAPARETVTESGGGARNGRLVTITARTETGHVEVVRD
ncbi:PspC domain-containing protein [Salinifilum ghardaiensis]